MMARQLALFDMSPICPSCKQQVGVLGQWAPGDRVYICHQCIEKIPLPDAFVLHDNSRGVGLVQDDSPASNRMREEYHKWINPLNDLRRGCVYTLNDIQNGYLPCNPVMGSECWANCRLCVARARIANRGGRYGRFGQSKPTTVEIPICHRCGNVHDNRYKHTHGYTTYCPRCDALNSVESFWRNRGIFQDKDPESILDRIKQSHPELFTLGVLPDYWFILERGTTT